MNKQLELEKIVDEILTNNIMGIRLNPSLKNIEIELAQAILSWHKEECLKMLPKEKYIWEKDNTKMYPNNFKLNHERKAYNTAIAEMRKNIDNQKEER